MLSSFCCHFGGHQLWSSVQAYRTDALSAQREATLVLDTSVELKLQVQEWKNLYCAPDAESLELYYRKPFSSAANRGKATYLKFARDNQ